MFFVLGLSGKESINAINTKSLKFYDSILCVPCNIDMNYQDIDKILDIIYNF